MGAPAAVRAEEAPVIVRDAAVDAIILPFLDRLKAGKVEGSLESLLGSSPLWQGKTLEIQNLRTQITGLVQSYGSISDYELIESRKLGTNAIRQYYLVRQDKMVIRWEFTLARTRNGWAIAYLGFDDQIRSWF